MPIRKYGAEPNLSTEDRENIRRVLDTLRKNGVIFIDANKNQRISVGRSSLLVFDPKILNQIPARGLAQRANPKLRFGVKKRKK